MFRRRTSSGKIHYRVNINKNMCLGVVDICIDGDTYQRDFNGSYLDIYRDKKIKTISIRGQIEYLNPKNEYNVILGISGGIIEGTLTYQYNSGMHCELANMVTYGDRITKFTPITEITDPEEIINFTYMPEIYNQITSNDRITWQGDLITNGYCIVTNACHGCQSVAFGNGVRSNYRVSIVIV